MSKKDKRVDVYFYAFISIILSVLSFSSCSKDNGAKIYETEMDTLTENVNVSVSDEDIEEYVYVQISGAVVNPGVYKVSLGIRIFEAVEIAGGVTEEAEVQAVNMARPVADEMQIYIPTAAEVQYSTDIQFWEEVTKENLIDINSATKEELMELPGIGEAKADAIISYREQNGMFKDISEIMNISGIKESAFSKIKDKIKV
jgi:competence protein ComEA